MCTQNEARLIIDDLTANIVRLFPHDQPDVILFGSYARNEASDESDIDVLYLVDASRQQIAEKNWQVGEAAADVLLKYGMMISPIVENRTFFHDNSHVLPFFQNIQREGVRLDA